MRYNRDSLICSISRRWTVVVTILLLSAFLLSGCGLQSVVDDDEPQETTVPVENTVESTETTIETENPDIEEDTAEQQEAEAVETLTSEPEPSAEIQSEQISDSNSEINADGQTTTIEDSPVENGLLVSTADEFLASITPGATIILSEGAYDLSTASDYGNPTGSEYYKWEECYDGFQLVIENTDGLTIRGQDEKAVNISAVPRYANVLVFRNCDSITLSSITAGHTTEPGFCAGGVVQYVDCSKVSIDRCNLYGCGVLGIEALNSREVHVTNTEIYECSYGAVSATNCYDFLLSQCVIRDCGTKIEDYNCYTLVEANGSTGLAVIDSEISGNNTAVLLKSAWSNQTALLGCKIVGNTITGSVFDLDGASPVVEGCSFESNDLVGYYPEHFTTYAVNSQGEDLISFDFDHMQLSKIPYPGPTEEEKTEVVGIDHLDGTAEYHVSTIDEFLASIGPDRTVYLDGELFDLASASQYGNSHSDYYRWENGYDGPGLIIRNVSNFHLIGRGKNETRIIATSLYADVLRFEGGENISLSNFTAGHKTTAECAGDVLSFSSVDDLVIDGCGLFGCGVNGISTWECSNIYILNCEIYSCSNWAVVMMNTRNAEFSEMDIHDMPSLNNVYLNECDNISCDGKMLENGEWNLMF